MAGKNAGFVAGLQYDCTGAVAEQHAGATVLPVQYSGKYLCADDQGGARGAALNEFLGHGQCINEAGTDCLDIECRAAVDVEPRLQNTGRTREDLVRGRCGQNDQIDFRGIYSGGLDR